MPRRSFKVPFAAAGEAVSIPTAAQPDGSVSLTQGYGPDYERPTDGTDPLAKVFPRLPYNGLMNEITSSIGEIQQCGFAIWSEDMAPYPINACVRHNDANWQSSLANNSAMPGSANSGWSTVGGGSTGNTGGQLTFTASGVLTIPAGVTRIFISGCGGGGGGGGGAGRWSSTSTPTGGGGGGGGAGRAAIKQSFTVQPGQTYAVTIGSGGGAGIGGAARGNGGNGAPGNATIVEGLVTLAAGGGGQGGKTSFQNVGFGGAGGSPGGQWGTNGITAIKGGDGGQGASGPFGTGGGGARSYGVTETQGSVATTIAVGYGSGGGGGGSADQQTNTSNPGSTSGSAGGIGMPGFLLVEW